MDIAGQPVGSEKPLLGDFPVWRRDEWLRPMPDDVKCDVIAVKFPVRIEPEQFSSLIDFYAGLFGKFADQRLFCALAPFDAAAWKMPSRPVGVADQKNRVIGF